MVNGCLWPFIHFIPVPGHAHSIQTGPGTSLCSCSGLSLPSRTPLPVPAIHSQTRPGISLFSLLILSLPGWASSRSVGTMQTQDCYTESWSCKSWIFYGNFTVRWGPILKVFPNDFIQTCRFFSLNLWHCLYHYQKGFTNLDLGRSHSLSFYHHVMAWPRKNIKVFPFLHFHFHLNALTCPMISSTFM